MDVTLRLALERNIITHLIDTALAAGWSLVGVWDGGENVLCKTTAEALEAVFSVDDCVITFCKVGQVRPSVWVVLGNGIDCISDHSVHGLFESEVMDVSTAYIEKIEADGVIILAAPGVEGGSAASAPLGYHLGSINQGHTLMTQEQEITQLPMMLTAIGQSMMYGEIDTAKKLQSLAMDWAKTPIRRDEIYAKDFAVAAGWTGTSSGLL